MAETNSRGALFKNDRKKNEKHPDYTGNITITQDWLRAVTKEMGTSAELKVDLAAWIKKAKTTFLSVSMNAPYKKEGVPTRSRDPLDDPDAPF